MVELSEPRWKPTVVDAVHLDQHGREQMLAGVLLHVVETARPVDLAGYFHSFDRLRGDMRDPRVLVDDVRQRERPPIKPRSWGCPPEEG